MDDDYFWNIPIGFIGAVIAISCFGFLCRYCYRGCSEASQNSSEEPRQVHPSQPPTFVPAMPSSPPPAPPFDDPPPYSEVAFKPNIWPLVDQLPSYDNIAMEGLPSPGMSQHPSSMPKVVVHNF